MGMKFSTGLKNNVLDTGSLKSQLDNGELRIYAGSTIPATADAALPGNETLLATYTDTGAGSFNLTFEASASNGTLSKTAAQTWQGDAVATDTATWFRYVKTGDTGTLSTTEVRLQGTVGGAGADIYLASTSFTNATTYYIDAFAIAIPDL